MYSKYKRPNYSDRTSWSLAPQSGWYRLKARRSSIGFAPEAKRTVSCDLTQDTVSSDQITYTVYDGHSENDRMFVVGKDLEHRAKVKMINWLNQYSFKSFISLTLDDKKTLKPYIEGRSTVGVQSFHKNLFRVLDFVSNCIEDEKGISLWVMEKQIRGAWHAHIVTTCQVSCSKIVKKIWKLGNVDVMEYEERHGTYILKYIHKGSTIGIYKRELDSMENDHHYCPSMYFPAYSKLDKRRLVEAKMFGREYVRSHEEDAIVVNDHIVNGEFQDYGEMLDVYKTIRRARDASNNKRN